jgi:HSP20 family protein
MVVLMPIDDLWDLERPAAYGRAFSPPTDVYSTENTIVVSIELPGVPEEALAIESATASLTIRGTREHAVAGGKLDYHHLERTFGAFHCRVALPAGADSQKRTVSLEDGVLTVEIPRRA